jgi:hypothetical protein
MKEFLKIVDFRSIASKKIMWTGATRRMVISLHIRSLYDESVQVARQKKSPKFPWGF